MIEDTEELYKVVREAVIKLDREGCLSVEDVDRLTMMAMVWLHEHDEKEGNNERD